MSLEPRPYQRRAMEAMAEDFTLHIPAHLGKARIMALNESERLKGARRSLGLTERQMAAALGMRGKNAKDDLRKMEEGMRPVTGPVLVAAEALVVIRDLLVTAPPVATDAKMDAFRRARAMLPGVDL